MLQHSLASPQVNLQVEGGFGRSVAIDGALAVIGAPLDDTGAEDAGVVKVFDAATGNLLHVIPNPDPAAFDFFGGAVAISGTTVVVGASGKDLFSSLDVGKAYIFDLAGPSPSLPIRIIANPDAVKNSRFGYAVAVEGSKVIVSSVSSATGFGIFATFRAYCFDLNSSTPTTPAVTFANPGGGSSSYFGVSLALDGETLVVGSLFAAYVYQLDGATPSVPFLVLPNPGPTDDNFGREVALSGALVLVGAPYNDSGALNAGSAYVFDLSSGTPTVPIFTFTNPDPDLGELFSDRLAISGLRAVVCASASGDDGNDNSGRVYLFDLGGLAPSVPVVIGNPSPARGDWFGDAAAFAGEKLVLGAPGDELNEAIVGSAYVFDFSNGVPGSPVAKLQHPGLALNEEFGRAVAASGSIFAVGMPSDDAGGADAGKVFVYDLNSPTPETPFLTLFSPSPRAREYFGNAVDVSGGRIVVGAYQAYESASARVGRVYVYDLASATPETPAFILNNPFPNNLDHFGYSVAIDNDIVVVGAPQNDKYFSNDGVAYVFDLSNTDANHVVVELCDDGVYTHRFGSAVDVSGSLVAVGGGSGGVKVYQLSGPSPHLPALSFWDSSNFGFSISLSGSKLAMGAPAVPGGTWTMGKVYLYDLSSLSHPTMREFLAPSQNQGDQFGYSVSVAANWLAVGAPASRTDTVRSGRVCLYDLGGAAPMEPDRTLSHPAPAAGDMFGYALAACGNRLIVGAPYDDTYHIDNGSAQVYVVPVMLMGAEADVLSGGAGGLLVSGQIQIPAVSTAVSVEYGTTAALGSSVSAGTFGSSGVHSFALTLFPGGLTIGATYYYRVVATNSAGSAASEIRVLTMSDQEIEVFDGASDAGVAILDGQASLVSFGFLPMGTSVTRTFTVKNAGQALLHLSGITVPPPFELASAFSPVSLAHAATASFQIRFRANTTKGLYGGMVSVSSNDADEGVFEFPVSARATIGGDPSALDLDFDSDGKLTTPVGGAADFGNAVIEQADGKILVAGYSTNETGSDFALARYLASGALDAGFGAGGKIITPVGSGFNIAHAVAVQADGKILVAGRAGNGTNDDFALVRYTSGGALDTTFGTGGKVVTAIGDGDDAGYGLALQPDGKIIVAGSTYDQDEFKFALARFTVGGGLDAGFGAGGLVTTSFGSGASGSAVVLQPDGKIILAGRASNADDDIAVVRYLPDGALDSSFGTGGKVSTDVNGTFDMGRAVALQPDGRIVVAGDSFDGEGEDVVLVRYTSAGALDTSFGTGGKVLPVAGTSHDLGNALAIQIDGKMVVAGYSFNGTNGDFVVLRYTPAGVLDAEFGNGGRVAFPMGDGEDSAQGVAVLQSGKILVAGYAETEEGGFDFALARLGRDLRPSVMTSAASPLTDVSATLNGTVNPNGVITSAWFEHGTTAAYGAATGAQALGYGTAAGAVTTTLAGLTPGTVYHFRLVAQNGDVTTYGADMTFTSLTVQQAWRQAHFGTTENTGGAADLSDLDGDGLANLLEWCCRLDPTQRSVLDVAIVRGAGLFDYSYTRSVSALNAGAGFIVEWSDSLLPGGWQATGVSEEILSDDGVEQRIKASVPIGPGERRFARLRVVAPP